MQIFGVTGEALGSIGTQPESEQVPALEPEWKRLLVAKPSVSLRKGIAWVSTTVRLMLLFCLGGLDLREEDEGEGVVVPPFSSPCFFSSIRGWVGGFLGGFCFLFVLRGGFGILL